MRGEPIYMIVSRNNRIRVIAGAVPGLDAAELIGRRISKLVPRRWRGALQRAHHAVFDCGQPAWLRLTAYHPNGDGLMHYECLATPIRRDAHIVGALIQAVPLDGRDILVLQPRGAPVHVERPPLTVGVGRWQTGQRRHR